MHFCHDDGSLILADWATASPLGDVLSALSGERGSPMYGTEASGDALVSNGHLGVDLIRVPAGGGFAPHTHPGDHLLIVVKGEGTITYEGRIYPTRAGQVYMVEGAVPHAVGAITEHCILAVGAPHRPVDAVDRMALTEYASVASRMGRLECLACGESGTPDRLRNLGCQHVPAQPGDGVPLVVGLAPATAQHEKLPAFVETRSGSRLADLLGVDASDLLDAVETVNLSGEYLEDWQSVKLSEWRASSGPVLARSAGRVVIACGTTVAAALGASRGLSWGAATILPLEDAPALLVLIPHPSGLSRAWNEEGTGRRARTALGLARTLARTGPRCDQWTPEDADAFSEAVTRAGTSG